MSISRTPWPPRSSRRTRCCCCKTRRPVPGWRQDSAAGAELATLLEPAGLDRMVVHQATGMIAAQLDVAVADALATLRAAAFASGRPLPEVAVDVVDRRISFHD